MMDLLKLAYDINTKFNKKIKNIFKTKNSDILLIIYYITKTLLVNKESKILKRLCESVNLDYFEKLV